MEGVEEGTVWDGGGHRYALEKVVGHGAFGIVWRARAEDGETVAIKKVMLDRRYHNRELQMMKVMEHENVIRLRHYFEKAGRKKDETFLHLVMDYLPETIRSTALKHHKRAKRFHVDHIKAYLWQAFRALEYIHARRICHRDIKPDNLLCDPASLKCRLCDFGCSKARCAILRLPSVVELVIRNSCTPSTCVDQLKSSRVSPLPRVVLAGACEGATQRVLHLLTLLPRPGANVWGDRICGVGRCVVCRDYPHGTLARAAALPGPGVFTCMRRASPGCCQRHSYHFCSNAIVAIHQSTFDWCLPTGFYATTSG